MEECTTILQTKLKPELSSKWLCYLRCLDIYPGTHAVELNTHLMSRCSSGQVHVKTRMNHKHLYLVMDKLKQFAAILHVL